ncbi:MAG: hypothetical protein JST82_07395 [Bacteroidetes bacterium]|nr:hypothetical protein [Bacteroidota bacterium]
MKRRTKDYMKKTKAMKIMTHVNDVDLGTFLSATFQLAKSNVVKKHIQIALNSFALPAA